MSRVISFFLIVFFVFTSFLLADDIVTSSPQKNFGNMQIGLSMPFIGVAKRNSIGEVIGYQGINSTIGYSSINYFKPLVLDNWNGYWTWGTLLLILPYFGFGVDYQAANGFFAGIGTIYIFPEIHLGVRF